MNVSSIGQGLGSVVTLPGPQTNSVPALSSARDSASATASARPLVDGPKTDAAVVRLAWFDLNGDGHIDSRSSLAGGDGTLIVPKHTSHPEIFSHSVTRRPVVKEEPESDEPAKSGDAPVPEHREPVAPVTNDVQTRQAISAYQRYGQPTDDAAPALAVA